jgi:RHS repeat-associated protein
MNKMILNSKLKRGKICFTFSIFWRLYFSDKEIACMRGSIALNGSAENKFKFNGKEEQRKEFADGSGLEWLDYGARMYDNLIGRFFNVHPKVSKMPGVSPYVFCFNNPLIYVDPDGQYPIYILTRAYAPFKTFGPNNNWYDDNRGHTLDRGASYRSLASINYDTETGKTQAFGGHSRSHTIDGKKDAISPTLIDYRTKSGNNFNIVLLPNPFTPGTLSPSSPNKTFCVKKFSGVTPYSFKTNCSLNNIIIQ